MAVNPIALRAAGGAGLPGDFLRQTAGARPLALGGAFGALADDASSVYWNPAGLALLDKPQVTGTHVILFEDTMYDFFAAGLPPHPWGALGLAYARQSSGNFEARNGPLDSATSFSVVDNALLAGWGWTLPSRYSYGGRVSVGAALKWVGQSIANTSASGWGADVGVNVAPLDRARLAVYLQNAIQPRLTFVSQPTDYVRTVRVSGAYDYPLRNGVKLTPVIEASKTGQDSTGVAGGLEVGFKNFGALRFGMQTGGFSTGLGLRWGNVQADYGVLLHDLGLTHQMTFSLRFGQTMEELQDFIRTGIQRFTKDEASRLARAYLQQGEMYWKGKNYTRALQQMEAASLWDPSDRHIEERVAQTRAEVDTMLTQQIFDRTVLLAEQQMERGNYLASQAYWNSILEMDPQNEKAKAAMSRIEQALNLQERTQLKEAEERSRRERADRALSACRSLVEKGRYRNAIAEAERSLKTSAASDALTACRERAKRERSQWTEERYAQALKLADAKQTGKAVEMLESVLSENPDYPGASDKMAQLKQLSQAPLSPEARKNLDREYYEAVDAYLHGRYKEADEFIGRILSQDSLNENALKLREKVSAAVKISQ